MNPSILFGSDPNYCLSLVQSAIKLTTVIEEYSKTGQIDYDLLDQYYFSNMFKKHPFLSGDDVDTSEATLLDFKEAELRAKAYHSSFEARMQHPEFRKYLNIWRDQVHLIMGRCVVGKAGITSGATTTVSRGQCPVERFHKPHSTAQMDTWIKNHDEPGDRPWDSYTISIGTMSIVPKTAFIGRVVITPCAVNAFEQKRIHKTLVQRLRVEGIDLSISQDVHRRLASFSSIRNHLTTDDQKWASPLIYTNLVKHLVPEDWFAAMSASRDVDVLMPDGSTHNMAQFAATGNGYCFELETIIFLGLLRTAALVKGVPIRHKDIKVFGDDLIYPRELTAAVRSIGSNVGFITNVDKSFSDGPFRESCGGDYLEGQNIRPIYLKQDMSTPFGCTLMANQLYTLYIRHERRLPLCYDVWLKLIRRIYLLGGRKSALWGPRSMQCLHGHLPGTWRITKLESGRWMIKSWKQSALKMYSFREIAYDKETDYLLRMVSAGYCKGMGAVIVPTQRMPRGIFGPPRPAYSKYPRNIAQPGTSYKAASIDSQLFFYPSMVDETNPLSVFKILPMTRCSSRIYSRNYLLDVEREKTALHRRLLSLLNTRHSQKLDEINSFDLSLVSFDF